MGVVPDEGGVVYVKRVNYLTVDNARFVKIWLNLEVQEDQSNVVSIEGMTTPIDHTH